MLKKATPEVLQSLEIGLPVRISEENIFEEKFKRFKYRFGWIVQAIFIICFVILTVYTIKYIHQLKTNPCDLCREMDYICTYLSNPGKFISP